MTAHAQDAEGDDRVVLHLSDVVATVSPSGQVAVALTQEDADALTASLVERQLGRWRDPDTDGPVYASSGVSQQLRGALAAIRNTYGEGALDIVEGSLEVWADVPDEHVRHMVTAGWPVH